MEYHEDLSWYHLSTVCAQNRLVRYVVEDIQLQVCVKAIRVAELVKNLGVYSDTSLTMEKQVNAISKACNIRNMALVTLRLEYGNALLYGFSGTLMTRLQGVQNSAARLVTRTRNEQHITPVFLH